LFRSPIPWLDGSPEEVALAGQVQASEDLNAFIDQVLEAEGLSSDALALVGFSQGTMMSLHIAPRRGQPIAALVGFSGRMLQPETLEAEAVSKPPVLLIHGDADPMVPVQSLPEAADALVKAGFETYAHVCKGVGHSIDNEGLSLALGFLKDKLPG
ncbi:alpha/beta hydrolase, partial [Pararhodobacter marinus]|uniref:alpha/beta hydrolase n=1 Tax=Pararhodobacter marinus TaxID=2184063 RepID=UPI0035163E59